jgi:hypothetical protein
MKNIFLSKLFFLVAIYPYSHSVYSQTPSSSEKEKNKQVLVLKNDIVINEIMADINPAPSGLPAYEYIELYNRTASPISLRKWKISDASSTATIPDIVIQPDSFFVLTGTTAATAFGSSIQVKGVPSFPSLNDAGENLSLKDSAGTIISSVAYTNSWYNDALKANGGWSMEQIDVQYTCAGKENWKATLNTAGGTPGKRNSVNSMIIDTLAPRLTHYNLIDSLHIQIYFSEACDSMALGNVANYSIDKGVNHPFVAKPLAPDYKSAVLTLTQSIPKNSLYTLHASGIPDCKGNTALSQIQFGNASPCIVNDVVINEIMFDPRSGGVEWIELYNRSNKMIDLKEISFCSYDANGLLSEINSVSSNSYLFFPKDYIVLSKNDASIKNNYYTGNPKGFLNMKDIPTLTNDSDWVVIINASQTVVDKVHYHEKWHLPLLNETKGISLERISVEELSQKESNWHSAAESCGFATPAYQNSQFIGGKNTDELKIIPAIFSPDNDGYNDVLSIAYLLNEPGWIASLSIFDSEGRLIKQLVKNELLASSGTFFWDGFTDENRKATIGIYILYMDSFNTKGELKKYKQAFTLAGKL